MMGNFGETGGLVFLKGDDFTDRLNQSPLKAAATEKGPIATKVHERGGPNP